MSKAFADLFYDGIKTRYPKVFATRSTNHYCKYEISEQNIFNSRDERYRFINIQNALHKHGTIEIRAFGANKPKKMYEYFKFTHNAINKFIYNANHKGILNQHHEIVLDDYKPLSETREATMKPLSLRTLNFVEVVRTPTETERPEHSSIWLHRPF